MVFLCNPNNPTGTIYPPEVVLSWVRRRPHTLFVVDEAYQRFAPGLESLVSAREENLLVLRSLTKDYALAGLRLGYAAGSEAVIAALSQARPPWSVNALAQAAGVAALGDERHLTESLAKLVQAKEALARRLAELGLDIWPSAAHFFLVRVRNGAGSAVNAPASESASQVPFLKSSAALDAMSALGQMNVRFTVS